jgi:hypothetical protein
MREALYERAPGAAIAGFMVQRMGGGLGEAVVGLTRDPVVGPMVTVGLGGTLAEIYADIAVRPAPVTHTTAAAMIEEIRGFAPLRGYRGAEKGDLGGLAAVVVALSRLALAPRVLEAEMNPVLVAGDGVVAVDALIRLGG